MQPTLLQKLFFFLFGFLGSFFLVTGVLKILPWFGVVEIPASIGAAWYYKKQLQNSAWKYALNGLIIGSITFTVLFVVAVTVIGTLIMNAIR